MDNETTADEIGDRVNGAVNGAGAEIRPAIQEAARKVGTQAAELGDQVYRQAMDAGRYVSRQVEEQPWIAAALCGAVGLIFGYMAGLASAPKPRSARDYVDDYLPRVARKR